MEHYDWNDGWLFAPTFDPAIVRPECTGVELEPVRLSGNSSFCFR